MGVLCTGTPHMLSCAHGPVCHSQVLPSKVHKGFVSFCNGRHWPWGYGSHGCVCPAQREQPWRGGGGSLPPQRAGQPHLASGGKHNSPHPGWAFRSRISLGRKGGRDKKEGGQKKALSSYDSLNKTKPGQGTPCLIRKTHVFN